MLSLIVNADDFGLTREVNAAILKSYRNGILRSASLMANGRFFDDAVGIAKSNPKLDIGVHLTLVGERPILETHKISSLVSAEKKFHKNAFNFSIKYFSNNISLKEVKNEFTAQIEKIKDYGIKISHIDSHQDLHILPKILDIVIELANNYKIKFVRIPKERFSGYMFRDLKSLSRIAQMITVNHFCTIARKKISLKTDHFAGFYFGGKLSKQNLLNLINILPADGVCELMCHPGLTEDSTNYSHWKYRQLEEMHTLIDKEVADALMKKNIEITSFKNLAQ